MQIKDLSNFGRDIKGEIKFDYCIKKLNWFNIGGKAKIFFKPQNLKELKDFLLLYNKRGKIFILGAGSNVLFNDKIYEGVVIKLGSNFSNISQLDDTKIIAGSSCSQKKLSEYAKFNNLSGMEFMSCIPGSIGGGLKMNSGCFGSEFKDVLISIQTIDFNGNLNTYPVNKIEFKHRGNDLPKDLIFLSATFKGNPKSKEEIENLMNKLKLRKEKAQPTKIKTGGSTFKNPIDKTNMKVWQLINSSLDIKKNFGDAYISEKHANFFVNKRNASFSDMKSLIEFVKNSVKIKTGIDIDLEIIIVDK